MKCPYCGIKLGKMSNYGEMFCSRCWVRWENYEIYLARDEPFLGAWRKIPKGVLLVMWEKAI